MTDEQLIASYLKGDGDSLNILIKRYSDYIYNFINQYVKNRELAEVFNNVIEEWNPYKKIFKFPTRLYKGTEVMFEKMKKQWEKNQDIDLLLDKLLLKP